MTDLPASARSTAAARPAKPPPIIRTGRRGDSRDGAIFDFMVQFFLSPSLSRLVAPSPRRLRPFAERDQEPLWPMQSDPVIEDVVIEVFYLFEQAVIDFA